MLWYEFVLTLFDTHFHFPQGMFATYIPAILDYMSSHTEYHGAYKPTEGRKYVKYTITCSYKWRKEGGQGPEVKGVGTA